MSEFHYVRTLGPDGGVDAAEGRAVGIDLSSLLDAGLPPLRVAVQIVAAVAEILAITEEDGVVHGDLDLDHVFVDDTGAVSIEGFGLRTTIAPEGTPVGPQTDRFGLGVLAYALLSPHDLADLPEGEEAHENAVIDAALGVNLDGLPEDLIGDVQWYLVRLLAFHPHDRPAALEVMRAFATMTDLVDGPDFAGWCDAALDGGGERRDAEQASRPMSRPLKGELDETSVTGGPLAKGAVNFEDGAVDKGRSTAFWTRQGMKDAIARAMTSDYIEADGNSDWMPGTPIPPMDRNTSPGGQRWSGPAPVPKRAPGEGRSRADKRASPPSPLPAPPRAGKKVTPKAAPPAHTPHPAEGRAAPPTPTPAPPRSADAGFPSSFDGTPRDDDRTELGRLQVPTNKPPTPKPTPMRTFEPVKAEAPTQHVPAVSAEAKTQHAPPALDAPTEALSPAPDAPSRPAVVSRPRRGPSAPTPEPAPDPDTRPEVVQRPVAPNSPIPQTWSPASAEPTADAIAPIEPEPPPPKLSVEPPAPRHQGPIPEVDLSKQPDPFAEVEESGPNYALIGAIGAFVMVAVIFCVGVTGIGGVAAVLGPTAATAPAPAPKPAARPTRARPTPSPAPAAAAGEAPAPAAGTVARATAPDPAPVAPISPGVKPQPPAPAPAPFGVRPASPEPATAGSVRPRPEPSPSPAPAGSLRPAPAPAPAPVGAPRPAPAPTPRPDPLASLSPQPSSGFPPPAPGGSVRPGGPSSAPRPVALPAPGQVGDSILPYLIPAPAPLPDGSGPNAMQQSMRRHLQAATAARDAVVAGSPENARKAAKDLEFVNPADGIPPSWLPYVVDMQMEAWLMGNSPDLAAAGFKVAQIGQSCAVCHEGVRAGPTVTPAAVPPRTFAEADVMKRHAWAFDWMWVGLIANDLVAWTKGSTELADSPFPSVIFEDFPEEDFMKWEDQIDNLAKEGQSASTHDKRAVVFGKLLATCARCHEVYRKNKP